MPQNAELERTEELFGSLLERPETLLPQKRKPLQAPKDHAVYVVRNPGKIVVHVGRTYRGPKRLHGRLMNHVQGNSCFVKEYIEKRLKEHKSVLREGYTYQYIEVPDDRERALLESYAIAHLGPEHLGLGRPADI